MEGKGLLLVTKVVAHEKEVYILKDPEGRFWGIPRDSFTDGMLNRNYNGLSGMVADTAQECIKLVKDRLEIDHLIKQDIPFLVASFMVLQGLGREEAEAIAFSIGDPV